MRTATRPNRQTRDAIAAYRAQGLKSKPSQRETSADVSRPRPKRPRVYLKSQENLRTRSTRRDAEARRLLKTVRLRNAENALQASPLGRHMLQLTDKRSKAQFKESFARLTLHAVQQAAERARAHHQRVCRQSIHREYDSAWGVLRAADGAVRRAKRLLHAAVDSRGLVDAELRLLAKAGSR